MGRHRSTAVAQNSTGILVLDEILRRINYFVLGALLMIIGAVGSFVGVAFLGIALFGDAQFETVPSLIGAFSLTTGPPATLAGVRLLLNKPNESCGRSGFLERREVPSDIQIEPVHPDYDAQYEALMES